MNTLAIIIAKYAIILPVIIAAIVFWQLKTKQKRTEFVVFLLIGGVVSILLAKLGSAAINDPRPFVEGHFTPLISHAADNGFPSDHTLLASFIGWVVLSYSRKWGIAALIIAALVGLSRVYVGVHHLEDIIGSFVISGVGTLLVGYGITVWRKKKSRQ